MENGENRLAGNRRVMSPTEPLAVRIPEACRLIGIGRSTLYKMIAEGDLKVVKIGGATLVPMKSLRGIIENL
ncbi:helix-turn-helix transcriptional regulator [Novosphingobium sp. YAF33]|uniref:helix-turn-helix transcriptional regulator n=1 Tax=Novosphingobium sp. YAF33 TaxID=3233082 RepID=UPI003F99CD52